MGEWFVCTDCGKVLHESELATILEPVIVGDKVMTWVEVKVCPHCKSDIIGIEEDEIEFYKELERDE